MSKIWSDSETDLMLYFVLEFYSEMYDIPGPLLSPDNFLKKQKPRHFFVRMASWITSKDQKQCKSKCQKMQRNIRSMLFRHLSCNASPTDPPGIYNQNLPPQNAPFLQNNASLHANSLDSQSIFLPFADDDDDEHSTVRNVQLSSRANGTLFNHPDQEQLGSISQNKTPYFGSHYSREAHDLFFGNIGGDVLTRNRSPLNRSPLNRSPAMSKKSSCMHTKNSKNERQVDIGIPINKNTRQNSPSLHSLNSASHDSDVLDQEQINEFLSILMCEAKNGGIKTEDKKLISSFVKAINNAKKARKQHKQCLVKYLLRYLK